MKRKYLLIGLVISLAMIVGIYAGFSYKELQNKANATGASYQTERIPFASSTPIFYGFTASSTSMTTILPGATTTVTLGIDGARGVDLYMKFYSTSTPASLVLYPEYSWDRVNFYREGISSVSNGVTTYIGNTASSTIGYNIWTPLTATSTVSIQIPLAKSGIPFGSRYVRLNIACWSTAGTNCKLWGEAIKLPY